MSVIQSLPGLTVRGGRTLMRSVGMKTMAMVGLLALLTAPVVDAQDKGAWELGAFGRYTRYPGAFDSVSSKAENSYGFGGRIGWFFATNWSFELDGGFNATDLDNFRPGVLSSPLQYLPFHLRGIFNAPLTPNRDLSLLVGGGINYNRYRKVVDGDDWGVGALVGLRARLYRQLHFRVDGLVDYVPSPVTGDDNNVFLGAQAGLSLVLGGKCKNKLERITLSPESATLFTGQSQQFSTSGMLCDGLTTTPAVLLYDATGGAVSSGGNFTAGTAPGTYRLIVRSGKLADTSMVTVRANVPTSLDLTPAQATLDTGATQQFTARLMMADGTTRPVTAITATGGTITNGAYRAGGQAGAYRVIAADGGLADTSTVTIRQPPPPPTPIRLVLSGAHFAFDKYSLTRLAQDTLRGVADTLKAHPDVRIEVAGHTDSIGTEAYNMRLSQSRAESVRRFLVANGVAGDRITVVYFGESRPVADNGTRAGRAMNRRVEVTQRSPD